ncbi:MAG: alpha/beta hydrolase [Alphaproteobacteria bacterium]|nr:alpha/beta hydrolase [Alphaproteobacteria bacterium]
MIVNVTGNDAFLFTNGRDFDVEKPTILFVHGAGMDHSVWTLQARYFAHHGANAMAVDLPGHGRSEGPPLPSIEAMGDWVAALTDALVADRAVLVGHSMGALICLDAASRHSDKVKQLALLGAAPAMPVHPALLEAAEANRPLAAELVSSWGHGPTGHIGGNLAPGGWLMGHALKLLAKAPANVLHNDLSACNAYERGAAAADSVRCPTLIISGSQDRMTPAKQGAFLANAIDDARLVTIEGSGHLMLVEKPDATLDALIDVLP